MAPQPPRRPANRPAGPRDPSTVRTPGRGARPGLLLAGTALLGLAVLLVGGAVVARPRLVAAYEATWTAHHQPAPNPVLQPGCGLDIGLLVDRSGSIANAGAAPQMRAAAKAFVDALAGTPSRIGVWTFGTHSAAAPGDPAHPAQGLTEVGGAGARTGVAALQAVVDAIPIGEGAATNWDAAFQAVHAASMASGQPPDVLVVLTDGQPTVFGAAETLPDPRTEDADIDAGIASANLVKGDGTRIFAVGIGADVDAAALSLISGGTAWDRANLAVADYALTDFGQLTTTLRAAVSELCGGTITVQKVVRDGRGEERPEADWAFTLDGPDDPTWVTTHKTDDAGLTQFERRGIGSERLALHEEPRSGVTLLVDEITCANAAGPQPVLQRTSDGVIFDLGPTDVIACTFPNLRPPAVEPTTTTTTIPTTSIPTTSIPTTSIPTTSIPTTSIPPTTAPPPPTIPPTTVPPSTSTSPTRSTPVEARPVTVLAADQEPGRAPASLPRTGADAGRLVLAGCSLVGGGGLLTVGLRRRREGVR